MVKRLDTKELLDRLSQQYCVSRADLERALREEIAVPVSVFSTSLTPMEAIVKFLHEEQSLRFSEIGLLTGRDQRAIGVTYHRARIKMAERLHLGGSLYSVPVSVLRDEVLSPFEHVAVYLSIAHRLRAREIARLMGRDERTVGTILRRAAGKRQSLGKRSE